jgi:uncharacterized membrane protein YhaH (DUF805 family)
MEELIGIENIFGAFMGAFLIIFLIILILIIGVYIFTSLAYVKIGKKANLENPNLAWIPGIGPLILAYQASKMHWWPWLLYIGTIIPFINIIAVLILTAYTIIWHWRLFEAINKPGWWSILLLVPIVNLVIIGIAAWSE